MIGSKRNTFKHLIASSVILTFVKIQSCGRTNISAYTFQKIDTSDMQWLQVMKTPKF